MHKPSCSATALITGGNSGIGLAIAKKFTQENIKVAVADKIVDKATSWEAKKCDVANAEEVASLYTWVKKSIGVPDILVLNAGQGIKEKLTEGDPEKWQQILNTNIMGVLRCIRAFVPEMLQRKTGKIVFISSVAAHRAFTYGGIYAASKTAVEVIAETLRLETLPHLHITVVSPGITNTDFFKNEISGSTPLSETEGISPKEIAEDVYYTICKKSSTSINKIITRPVGQVF